MLADYHTFRLPVTAESVLTVRGDADWARWQESRRTRPLPELILGGGSNVVFFCDHFPGRVVRIATRGWRVVREDARYRWIEALAGEPWAEFVAAVTARGWGGLELLAAIPGTVGAAPVQNIGAYGLEVAERIETVTVWHRDSGEMQTLAAEQLAFGYRTSWFKTPDAVGRVVQRVCFRLPKNEPPRLDYPDLQRWPFAGPVTPQAVHEAVVAIRARKLPDPTQQGNAGSFFKNPIVAQEVAAVLTARHPALPAWPQPDGRVKLSAAWLIEACGLKGARVGQAAVSQRHALVLVNLGGARPAEVAALAALVQQQVTERFGVMLEPEPVVVR